MYSIRRWIFRPKKSDPCLAARFFYADEELNAVAAELDSFDGRREPDRCTTLVHHLRRSQDAVLAVIEAVADAVIERRVVRDFRVKFPDDILQEGLAGQLWFGAECLAAGSSIMNREVESASMRPLAKAVTRQLDYVRSVLRDQCLRNLNFHTDKIRDALVVFDRLFAEFELSYVSAMVPVKSMREYDIMQEVIVLFSETVQRALKRDLLSQEMLDDCEPALMFTIPRLAIVCGLLDFPHGPLNPDIDPVKMSEMFRPFQTLLYKIRELLWTLSTTEMSRLENILCSHVEGPAGGGSSHVASSGQHYCDFLHMDVPDRAPAAITDPPTLLTTAVTVVSDPGYFTPASRRLRHSLSWPEAPRHARQCPLHRSMYSPTGAGSRAQLTFHLPLNTTCSSDVPRAYVTQALTDVFPTADTPPSHSTAQSCACGSAGSSPRQRAWSVGGTSERNAPSTAAAGDSNSCCSSDTSSYTSESQDVEEITLAIAAAEQASRREARARFKSSDDLIHRLFVCISGVADQLQTNYAGDLRNILKCVFDMNASTPPPPPPADKGRATDAGIEDEQEDIRVPSPTSDDIIEDLMDGRESYRETARSESFVEPPVWVADTEVTQCTACDTVFTFVRRRHHCRNCGQIFCGRCSYQSIALPHYGHLKPVRVCNDCYAFNSSMTHAGTDTPAFP